VTTLISFIAERRHNGSESTEGANPDILVWAKLSGKKDPVPVSSEKSPALKIYLRKGTGGAIHWQAF
jgi:hypothetical protein